MKTCCDCNLTKSYDEFVPRPSCQDGYDVRCRKCRTIRYSKADPLRAFRKLYLSQITHSVLRGHPLPAYTFEELLQWANDQPNAVEIWDAYVASGYDTKLRPSIDRKDDDLPYTISNLKLMTWQQNRKNAALNQIAGKLGRHRPVVAYNQDGTLHSEYISIMEAVRAVHGHMWGIASVANQTQIKDGRGHLYTPRTYKGFIWKWS